MQHCTTYRVSLVTELTWSFITQMTSRFVSRSYGWGEPIKWGPSNLVDSAESCCEQCLQYKPTSVSEQSCNGACIAPGNFAPASIRGPRCASAPNTIVVTLMVCVVWVWCGDKAGCGSQYRECWLKHLVSRYVEKGRYLQLCQVAVDVVSVTVTHTSPLQAHPDAAAPREGPTVPWTAGVVVSSPADNADVVTVRFIYMVVPYSTVFNHAMLISTPRAFTGPF